MQPNQPAVTSKSVETEPIIKEELQRRMDHPLKACEIRSADLVESFAKMTLDMGLVKKDRRPRTAPGMRSGELLMLTVIDNHRRRRLLSGT